jgi:hypothetical protein
MSRISIWEFQKHLPAVVVGSSLGALVALEAGRTRPGRAARPDRARAGTAPPVDRRLPPEIRSVLSSRRGTGSLHPPPLLRGDDAGGGGSRSARDAVISSWGAKEASRRLSGRSGAAGRPPTSLREGSRFVEIRRAITA